MNIVNWAEWTAPSLSMIFPPVQMYITCAIAVAIFAVVVGRGPAVGFWGAMLSIVTAVPVASVVGCSLVTALLSPSTAHATYLVLNALTVLLLYIITVVLRMRHTVVPKPPSPPQHG